MNDLQNLIDSKPLIAEGAMGTMLQRQGIDLATCDANLQAPQAVQNVHRLYCEAGATCAITNTFGPCISSDADDINQAAASIQAAVQLARSGNPDALILGDMGPSGLVLEPLGTAEFEQVFQIYQRHIRQLVQAGVDALLLETFIDVADMRCAILAAKSVTDLPVVASFTFNLDLRMPLSSTTPQAAAVIAQALGASVVGTNCGVGPELAQKVVELMASCTNLPLTVQPNAGIPVLDGDGNAVYPGTPDQMASIVPSMLACGAGIIGSCCGSDPEFTQQIAQAVGQDHRAKRDDDQGVLRLASMQQVVEYPQGTVSFDDAVEFDCSQQPFDKWDILDSVSECPLLLLPDNSCEVLEQALKLYPGRAVVQVGDNKDAARLAAWYGAAAV